MRIRAILTLVITSFVSVYAQTPKTFHDPQGRFAVQVPSGWRATPINADCIQISNGGAYLTVIVSGGDPGMAMDAIAHQFSGQWHRFTKVREGDVQLGGHAATSANYSGVNPQGADANLKLIAMSDGGRTYLLMISATKAEFLRSKSALDQIEQSFQIGSTEVGRPPAPPVPAAPVAPPIPAPAPATARVTPQPISTHASYYRMKKVAVVDEHGFERPMQALTLLIPTDWQFQGSVQYNQNTACHLDIVHLAFRATSPDGRFAIEMFPDHHWQWSGDPQMVRMLQMSAQQTARYGRKSCDLMAPMNATEYLKRYVVPGVRRGANIVGAEPMTEMAQQLQQQAREEENMAARQGIRGQIRADVARVRLEYNAGGQNVEEWLTAETVVAGMAGPSFNMQTGRAGQAMYYDCGGYLVTAMRAPQGQLQSMEKFFLTVLSTIHVDHAWESRVAGVMAQMNADDSRAAMQRSAIATQYAQDTSRMMNQGYQSRSKMQDSAFHEWDQAIRGVQTFRNPNTGDTIELSNEYAHSWAGAGDQYILSNSEFFNPNVALEGNWTRLDPVKP
jgi:hypothetical protein